MTLKFEKPSPERMWATDFFQRHAKAALTEATESYEAELLWAFTAHVTQCESPLEAAFSAWWTALTRMGRWSLGIIHQKNVQWGENAYRLDLSIHPTSPGFYEQLIDHRACPRVAIELDGHEFHERTPAQVISRNQRDRNLQLDGWVVLHYSGSEFNRNPKDSVMNAYCAASGLFDRAMCDAGLQMHPLSIGKGTVSAPGKAEVDA